MPKWHQFKEVFKMNVVRILDECDKVVSFVMIKEAVKS